MPQVVKNGINMYQGNSAALEVLSWVGFVTALFGNTLLLSYFLSKGEKGASTVQAIGASSNVIMLSQIYMAGFMPTAAFGVMAVVTAAAVAVNLSKVTGLLDKAEAGGSLWGSWQDLLGLIGVAMLPQALWLTFTTSASLLPGYLCGGLGILFLLLEKLRKLPPQLQGAWASVPAWTATLLFMFQPVAQLVRNFAVPSSLQGLSVGTILLAMVGNGLMVPRALATKDAIWFTGSAWGSLMGWAQLLSMFLGHSLTGGRYLSEPAFALATVVYFGFNAAVLQANSSSKGLSSPLASLGTLASNPDAEALMEES
ncbi:hypothetical protein WJX72_011049 [[Myrmecia] bisecta]|uniref:Uncharacterized protein n=1 Tax=[Myrmecia] bisecta TaxID=41462 RepID=A0AAW1PKP9_9CHLO